MISETTQNTDVASHVAYIPAMSRDFGHQTVAVQFATVAGSADRLARARTYADRLAAHAAEVRARLDTANEAIALQRDTPASGPIRGELIVVERQLAEARSVLADMEAEHARHVADLRAAHGPDGEARAKLRERQAERDVAKAAAGEASEFLARAKAHAGGVEARLIAARAAEANYDADAAALLHAALRDGSELPTTTVGFVRNSPALEDDLRAARATVARLESECAAKVAAVVETERLIRGAVDAVIAEDAESHARELVALDARARTLRHRLDAYAERTRGDHVVVTPETRRNAGGWMELTSVPHPAPRIATSPLVTQARAMPQSEPRSAASAAYAAAASIWATYATDLARDAEANADFTITGSATLPVAIVRSVPLSTRIPSSWEANASSEPTAA